MEIVELQSGRGTLLLDELPAWQGRVTEAGVGFFGRAEDTAHIARLTLSPQSLLGVLRGRLDSWTVHQPWSQRSVNFVQLGGDAQRVHPIVLLLAWFTISLILGLALSTRSRRRNLDTTAIGMLFLIAWLALDALWLHSRLGKLDDTLALAAATEDIPHIDAGIDREIAQLVELAKQHLDSSEPQRILVVAEREGSGFEALRAKYHLLPHAAAVTDMPTARVQKARIDALLFIPSATTSRQGNGEMSRDPGPTHGLIGEDFEALTSTRFGVLFQPVKPRGQSHGE
jgi:hypothetical protein